MKELAELHARIAVLEGQARAAAAANEEALEGSFLGQRFSFFFSFFLLTLLCLCFFHTWVLLCFRRRSKTVISYWSFILSIFRNFVFLTEKVLICSIP